MALMNNSFIRRTLSSIVLVPTLLLLIAKGGVWFDLLCIILTTFLLLEWAKLWWTYLHNNYIKLFDTIIISVGILYIALAMYKYWTLKDNQYKQIMTFLIVWTTDVGAYIFGKKLGKTPLAPTVSPKKTWEGFWGGTVMCVLICSIVSYVQLASLAPQTNSFMFIKNFFSGITLFSLLVFSIRYMFYSVFAHIGDLIESWVKRYVGVKDSSQLIPGHGGFLDRFDSFLSVCLAYYLKDLLHYYGIFF